MATVLAYFLGDYKVGLIGMTSALAGSITMGFSSHSWELLVGKARDSVATNWTLNSENNDAVSF